VIFEWDDILMSTTYLIPYYKLLIDPNSALPEDLVEELNDLDI
jgi:hypothetical protein